MRILSYCEYFGRHQGSYRSSSVVSFALNNTSLELRVIAGAPTNMIHYDEGNVYFPLSAVMKEFL